MIYGGFLVFFLNKWLNITALRHWTTTCLLSRSARAAESVQEKGKDISYGHIFSGKDYYNYTITTAATTTPATECLDSVASSSTKDTNYPWPETVRRASRQEFEICVKQQWGTDKNCLSLTDQSSYCLPTSCGHLHSTWPENTTNKTNTSYFSTYKHTMATHKISGRMSQRSTWDVQRICCLKILRHMGCKDMWLWANTNQPIKR